MGPCHQVPIAVAGGKGAVAVAVRQSAAVCPPGAGGAGKDGGGEAAGESGRGEIESGEGADAGKRGPAAGGGRQVANGAGCKVGC